MKLIVQTQYFNMGKVTKLIRSGMHIKINNISGGVSDASQMSALVALNNNNGC